MTSAESTAGFAAFREALLDDFSLLLRLRPPADREAYIEKVIVVGAERGFTFDADAVRAALREGERTWLLQGADVA